MGRLRDPGRDEFAAYVEAYPARLACWTTGAPGRYPMLVYLNAEYHLQAEKLERQDPATFGRGMRALQNIVGTAAGWVTRYMRGPGRPHRTPLQNQQAVFRYANKYWDLKESLVELRHGARDYQSQGTLVRLPYTGDVALDTLDQSLGIYELVDSLPDQQFMLDGRLRDWLEKDGTTKRWSAVPEWAKDAYRRIAENLTRRHMGYLSPDTAIAGFTIGNFNAYWVELLAWAVHMYGTAASGGTDPRVVCPLVQRDAFARTIAKGAAIAEDTASRITSLLTIDLERCPNAELTPVAPVDGHLLPMCSLIMANVPQRNLIVMLQRQGSLGKVGERIGELGEQAAATTFKQRMASGILVGSRIKIVRANRQLASDIDTVVCDPRTQTVAFFEIKWHVGADDNSEVYRTLSRLKGKRDQVAAWRAEVASGSATIRWPKSWPDIRTYQKRWYVLANNVLATRDVAAEDVTIRSLQLVQRKLPMQATMEDLLHLLDSPPPAPDTHAATHWRRIRYGDLRVDVEFLGPRP